MKVDQDWWKTWFHKLNKDGHHELLRLYLDLKGKNPQHFYNLMDELWKLNHGTVNFYNKNLELIKDQAGYQFYKRELK